MTSSAFMNPLVDVVRDAVELGTPLRITGRAHWVDAGRPVEATRIASVAAHAGVVDYVPGDLTITVRGGTTLSEIERITAAEGQRFPLDPAGSADGTIGATIATGSFGPLAHSFGRARDLVLGVEFVTGDGKLVRGGGRVVKNVAGFDLVRLVTGSWGTIGIITEATLRLYSLPARPVTVAMTVPDQSVLLAQRLGSVLNGPLTPLRTELVSGGVASLLGLPPRHALLVELGGNPASVAAQKDSLVRLTGITELPAGSWETLRLIEENLSAGGTPIVLRISCLPARLPEIWTSLAGIGSAFDGALMHSTPALGIIRCILPGNAAVDSMERLAAGMTDVTVIYERLPAGMWQGLSPSVVSDRLSRGIMKAFDPHRILNPGILGPAS
ncbi:MAG: FAD-binding oxidoreductase [Gemmatimonadaceae bacterium]